MRIVTWNINSLRLRLGLLRDLVAALSPDIVCLQETKVPDALFPDGAPGELGFPYVARRGMKGYNGVAILSKLPLVMDEAAPDWVERGDCRHLAAAVSLPSGEVLDLHNFYVPAGGDIPDPALNDKFAHKLAFIDEATAWFRKTAPRRRAVLVGDLNIAPLEHDVWSHKQLLGVVSHTPVEVARLNALRETNFIDGIRHFVPEDQKLYTWWSYRNRDWKASDRGRRLDHIWVSPDLAPSLGGYRILREARDWAGPSDHVPVALDIDL